jgi:hypothetical protein
MELGGHTRRLESLPSPMRNSPKGRRFVMKIRDKKNQDKKGTITSKDDKERGVEKSDNADVGEGSGMKKDKGNRR